MGRALYLHHPSSLEHDTGDHPEQPARIVAIERALESRDWLGYEREQAPRAERAVVEGVHPSAYIQRIEEIRAQGGGMLDLDTVASAQSFDAAMHSAGGSVRAVEALLSGEAEITFCGLRPPGHHAEAARAMGFCLFNNVAIAARQALDGLGAERVLVLDWDVHHGNGTNDIFYDTDARPLLQHPPVAAVPGHRLARRERHRRRPGIHDQPPGAARGGPRGLAVPAGACGRPRRPRVPAGPAAGVGRLRRPPRRPARELRADRAKLRRDVRRDAGALTRAVAPLGFVLEGGYDLPALAASVAATMAAARDGAQSPGATLGRLAQHAREHYAQWWPVLTS